MGNFTFIAVGFGELSSEKDKSGESKFLFAIVALCKTTEIIKPPYFIFLIVHVKVITLLVISNYSIISFICYFHSARRAVL